MNVFMCDKNLSFLYLHLSHSFSLFFFIYFFFLSLVCPIAGPSVAVRDQFTLGDRRLN